MVGQSISHYSVIERLGAGGMGEIYKAQDTRLNRFVAIKVLTSSSAGEPERRRRFIQEGQAASALNHPNIITIYDIVSQDGMDCMVMELVAGQTLGECIPNGGMAVPEALRCAIQMADALSAAHAAGIVHRDLKPGNVMVTGSGLVKILDFGLAKVTGPSIAVDQTDETQPLTQPMTVEGSILGTVSYMSPEQAEGRRIDARSDIFSFGLVLYEMLTGVKAFADASAISTLSRILRDEAVPIRQVAPAVPVALEQIVNRALRKDPEQRWQSMREMHAELVSLKQRLDSTILMAPPVTARRKSSKAPMLAVTAVVVAAIAGGAWWWTNRPAAPIPATPANVAGTAVPPSPQAPATEIPATPAPHDDVLTNRSIVDMLQAKVPPGVIVGHIRSSKTKFDLTTAEIINLTKNGATSELLDAMRNPQAAAAPRAPVTPTPVPAPPAAEHAATQGQPVKVIGGIPMSIALTEDVAANPEAGQTLHFAVSKDLRMGDSVVVAKGTPLNGEIVDAGGGKVLLIKKSKATFRVSTVQAVDGSKLAIRATPGRRADKVAGSIEPPGRHDKEKLAPAGSEYLVYVDGDQTVTIRK